MVWSGLGVMVTMANWEGEEMMVGVAVCLVGVALTSVVIVHIFFRMQNTKED